MIEVSLREPAHARSFGRFLLVQFAGAVEVEDSRVRLRFTADLPAATQIELTRRLVWAWETESGLAETAVSIDET